MDKFSKKLRRGEGDNFRSKKIYCKFGADATKKKFHELLEKKLQYIFLKKGLGGGEGVEGCSEFLQRFINFGGYRPP